jgi:glycosyltransferase involved in cell wall biosynthesis
LRQASRFITHGQALAKRLQELAGEVAVSVRPHPIFEHYPDPTGELPRRAPLELLFFGLVRRYKGLDVALRGLAAAQDPDIRLTVVGEFWEGLKETSALIDRLGLKKQVELVPRFVSDAEAAEYFARADAILLPYRAVSGSGVVPVAYRYGKPVIVSDLPGLVEVVDDQETGWVIPIEDSQALGRLLAEKVTEQSARAMQGHIADKRKQMSWTYFVDAVLGSAG